MQLYRVSNPRYTNYPRMECVVVVAVAHGPIEWAVLFAYFEHLGCCAYAMSWFWPLSDNDRWVRCHLTLSRDREA